MLIVMSGLPGAGKSTLAAHLARALAVPVLSVDPIEAALWQAGIDRAQPTGLAAYLVAETTADGLLDLGLSVLIDAVNDAPEARAQWHGLAARRAVPLRYIEVRCTDPTVHRARLEQRHRPIPGFTDPTWPQVEARRAAFDAWDGERLVLDSVQPVEANVERALTYLRPGAA